jgi:hypothetical protein
MKFIFRIIIIGVVFTITSSLTFKKVDYREAMFKNVCKNFRNDVLIYFIFVDSKETAPWSEFDIKSTIDSMAMARKWLMEQAARNNIPLNIKTDYFIGKEFSTINRSLPYGTVQKTAVTPNLKKGLQNINDWADQIARKTGSTFNLTQKDGIPEVKSPRNKERLIAYLRDEYKVESVALLFFVNNYYRTDISLPVNTMTDEDIEFAIVSYKYPSEIAHNVLHLYGAADIYPTIFRRNEKKAKELESMFPNEIMRDPYAKNIRDMDISDYTKYLIGWDSNYKQEYSDYYIDKTKRF